jgi:hypothetical protein
LYKAKFSAMLLLMLLLSSAFALGTVLAQDDTAEVIIVSADGGTTDPSPGTYSYEDGTAVVLEATPDDGYEFVHWVIEGGFVDTSNQPPAIIPVDVIDPNTGELIANYTPPNLPPTTSTFESMIVTQNPLAIVCGYGYTFSYRPVFITAGPTERSDAIVIVKQGAGGSTDPGPGTYTFSEGSSITLTATASEGYEFQYWTAVEQGNMQHPTIITENPLAPTCGIGYTYEYQPVFTVTGQGTTTAGGIAPEILYAIIIVLAVVAVIAIAAALMYRSRK